MNLFYDQPAWIIVFGVIAIAIAAIIWSQTGRNVWLYAAASALALMLALLGLERFLISDTEALKLTVRQIARDVASNDRQLLYPHIHSSATALRQKADAELPSYQFTECTVTKIYAVEVTGDKVPKTGRVEFIVRVAGDFSYRGEGGISGQFLRYVILHFEQETDGKWRIKDYDHRDVQAAWMNLDGAGKQ